MEELFLNVMFEIRETPLDTELYRDALQILMEWEKHDLQEAHRHVIPLLQFARNAMIQCAHTGRVDTAEEFRTLIFLLYNYDAPVHFDSYLIALEYDRRPQDKFYEPRRHILLDHVGAMQALADDELDECFLSQPPRTGKSTLSIFFVTWLMGKDPEHPKLYCSYSAILTEAFYNGVLEVLTDADTYNFNKIFPGTKIVRTDSKQQIIDLNRRKHYPTLTCRSLYGTLNGSCDAAKGLIVSDDLLSGIEEAMSKDRLDSAWARVDNNLIPRGKDETKFLWIGTRWSIYDPIGRRLSLLETDEKYRDLRYRNICIPALNENDESNFVYKYGVGFSTEYYQRRRASFEKYDDIASWLAQYQGEPIEREGTLFNPKDMRFYNGHLPEMMPDRVYMVVDPAFGGGDYVSGPILVQYGTDIYVTDWVYNNGDKKITQPLIARYAKNWGVARMDVEASKTTEAYAEGIQTEMEAAEYHCTIDTHVAGTKVSKEIRIFDKAPDIKEHFIFLDDAHRPKMYQLAMQNVFGFKLNGKNRHDDAPDSLAMAVDYMLMPEPVKPFAIHRPM